jgi:hypothetical protein
MVMPGCPGETGGQFTVSLALDDPFLVVRTLELEEGLTELLDRVEPPHPEEVLLQRPE